MAVEVESQGQIQEFLGILRRRRWQVLLPALFVFVLGCAFSAIMPRMFLVATKIEIKPIVLEERELGRDTIDTSTSVAVGAAQHQIKHYGRIEELIRSLGWRDYLDLTEIERREYIADVIDNLEVQVLPKATRGGSDFVEIEFKDIDGVRAAEFLNELAKYWVLEVVARDRKVLEAEMEVFQDLFTEAQNKKDKKGRELQSLITQYETSLFDLVRWGSVMRDVDPVERQKQNLEISEEAVRLEIAETEAHISALREDYDEEEPFIPVPIAHAGVSLDSQRASIELEIQDLQEKQTKYRPLNKSWQIAQDRIDDLRAKLANLSSQEVEGTFESSFVQNERREDLRIEIEELEAQLKSKQAGLVEIQSKLLAKRAEFQERAGAIRMGADLREEILGLEQQYTQAHSAYVDRQSKLAVLDMAHGAPFEVVESAFAPENPTEPNPLLIVAFGLVAGLAIGLGSAFLAEYSKSCYRSVADVTRVLAVPVLGVVSSVVTEAEVRRRRLQRFLVGISSFLILGSIVWFTYAVTQHPDWLGQDLQARIENFRRSLR